MVVVAAACVAVALTMGQGEAKPKDAYALIFGIVGVYIVLLFFLQFRDLRRAEEADMEAAELDPREIENPALLSEPELWAAMALRPIDADAMRARKDIWGTTRASTQLGVVICVLIFLSVPPIYLLDTFVPILIGAPLIAGIALWKSAGLLSSGGELDKAYESASRAMAPLGLSVVERPDVVIRPKYIAPLRMGPSVEGELVMAGERFGRPVEVRMGGSSEVFVAVSSPSDFSFKSRDGRVRPSDDAPAAVREVFRALPNSTRWNGVSGNGGSEGVLVERKRSSSGDWLLDLWLAERLADSLR